ncbi:MAG: L-fucose:H+ symporter permease [Pirellulales bacterium]|nr:L-fucose:H+ symporter permease [Pirellulales bacterium]
MAVSNNNSSDVQTSPSVVPRQYLYPFALVTTLFALWGFANDVTNPLVKAFKDIFLISNFESSLVQFAFYGGYAIMAIPAALVIRKFSFKAGIISGLALYATGALLFIPASLSMQFYFFLMSFFILTCGLAFLETSANPYILSMGAETTATRRLNFAQAFNPMGSLAGMFVASQLILPNLEISKFREQEIANHPEYANMNPADVAPRITSALEKFAQTDPAAHAVMQATDLATIRVPYVVIALVVLVVLATFGIAKMPNTGHSHDKIDLGQVVKNLMHFRYVGGVIAQAFYVGAQIMCWTFVIHYGMTLLGLSAAEAQEYNIAAMIVFVTSRFVCTFILKYLRPGMLLGILAIGGMLLTLGTIFLQGFPGLYCLVGISACMSLMFPTIYGIALDGLSVDDAKLGSAGLIFAIVGGAVFPPLQARIIDAPPVDLGGVTLESIRASFVLPLVCFVVIAIYGFMTSKGKSA